MFHALIQRWVGLIILQFWLKLASALVFSSLFGAILGSLLARDGSPAIGNSALFDFALSPWGVLTIALIPMTYLSVLYFEQACILHVLAHPKGEVVHSILRSLVSLPRVLLMATIQTSVAILCVAPFAALAWLTYWLLISDADINFYLTHKPPKFIAAVSIGILLSIGAICVLGWLLLKWFHALPRLIFTPTWVLPCLWNSWRESRAKALLIMTIIFWFIIHVTLYFLAPWIVALTTIRLFSYVEHDTENSVLAGAAILLANGIVLTLVTISSQCWLAAAIWTTYPRKADVEAKLLKTDIPHSKTWLRPMILLVAASIASLSVGLIAIRQVLNFTVRQSVQIVAHRAGAKGFPENSLTALQHAISIHSNAAEIDVQQSRDGTVFVVHDRDLRRLAGVPLVISEATIKELGAVDIGSQLKPPAPKESLATLEDFLRLSQNKIRLSIELKYYGFKTELAEAVLALLEKYPSDPNHEIISLEYRALAQVAKLRPDLRRGYLVSASVGDITRLDANFLSVSQGSFSPKLLEDAKARGMDVAVWTVNDRESMFRLMVQGAEMIVTDDPETAVDVAREYAQLSELELLLVRLRETLSQP